MEVQVFKKIRVLGGSPFEHLMKCSQRIVARIMVRVYDLAEFFRELHIAVGSLTLSPPLVSSFSLDSCCGDEVTGDTIICASLVESSPLS